MKRRGRPFAQHTTNPQVSVPAHTFSLVLRIKEQFEFQRMGDVVDLVTRGIK